MEIIDVEATVTEVATLDQGDIKFSVEEAFAKSEVVEGKKTFPLVESLQEIVDEKLTQTGANSDRLVVTDTNKKDITELRTTINKIRSGINAERTAYKEALLADFKEFEDQLISGPIASLDGAYANTKNKIDEYTQEGYKKLEENLRTYWASYAETQGIGFIPFEKLELKVNSSMTETKAKKIMVEKADMWTMQVGIIQSLPVDADRIMDYFKESLDTREAMAKVKEENEIALRVERDRALREEQAAASKLVQQAPTPEPIPVPAPAPLPIQPPVMDLGSTTVTGVQEASIAKSVVITLSGGEAHVDQAVSYLKGIAQLEVTVKEDNVAMHTADNSSERSVRPAVEPTLGF